MLIALVPEKFRASVLRTWWRNMMRNLFIPRLRGDVRAHFGASYAQQDFSGHLDGNTGWYLRPLGMLEKKLPQMLQDPSAVMVDLGCGMGTAAQWLRMRGWRGRSVGIDFIPALVTHHANLSTSHSFVCADIAASTKLPLDIPVNLFVAVNAFVFVEQPESLLRRLHEQSAPDARLLIVDPHPSGYWRPETPAYIRPPHVWQDLFNKAGWIMEAQARTALYRIAGKPILPLAQGYLCRRA